MTPWQDLKNIHRPVNIFKWLSYFLICIFVAEQPVLATGDTSSAIWHSSRLPTISNEHLKIIPVEWGEIKRLYRGKNSKFVIHIQDLHINEAAQLKIARIIHHLSAQYGVRLIQMEGAAGELAHGLLSKYPNQKARQLAALAFLKEGLLTGPEFLAIVKNPRLILFGIENKELYEKNREALLRANELEAGLDESLAGMRKRLKSLAAIIFSSNMKAWLAKKERFENHSEAFMDYAAFLQTSCFTEKLNCEMLQITRLLKKEVDGIDTGIFSEIKQIELKLEAHWIQSPDAQQLYRLFQILNVYEKMFALSLNRENVEFLYQNRMDFDPRRLIHAIETLSRRYQIETELAVIPFEALREALAAYEHFYELALARDEALITNSLKSMQAYDQDIAVLVSGGFHTPAIEKQLEKQGFGFCAITPALDSKIDFEKDQKLYFESMELKQSPVAEFVGARDPTLQLQIPSHLPTKAELEALPKPLDLPALAVSNPRIDYLTAMMIETAVTGIRLGQSNVEGAFETLSQGERPFAAVYEHLHQPGTISRFGESGKNGEAFVPYTRGMGFGMQINWKPATPSAVSFRRPHQKSFSLVTSDRVFTEIRLFTDPAAAAVAQNNFEARSELRESTALVRKKKVMYSNYGPNGNSQGDKKPKSPVKRERTATKIEPVPTNDQKPTEWQQFQEIVMEKWPDVSPNYPLKSEARSELRCGYLDLIAARVEGTDGAALVPSWAIDTMQYVTYLSTERAQQASGWDTLVTDSTGNVVLLGSKDGNPFRVALDERMFNDVRRELRTAQRRGLRPLKIVSLDEHLRYSTVRERAQVPKGNKKKEAQPQAPPEKFANQYSWSDGAQPIKARRVIRQISMKLNGDNDGLAEEEEILAEYPFYAFGKKTTFREFKKETSRFVSLDDTKGDTRPLATLASLYAVQGLWNEAARYAYLTLAGDRSKDADASSFKDAFAGMNDPKAVDKLVVGWGLVFEGVFFKHKEKIFVKENGKWVPDRDYLENHFIPELRKTVRNARLTSKDKYLSAFSEKDLNDFIETTVFAFLYQDMELALQMILANPLPTGTHGVSVSYTLDAYRRFWISNGQPGALGFNPDANHGHGVFIAASDPGAVLGGLNANSRLLPFRKDYAEMFVLDMNEPFHPVLTGYSGVEKRYYAKAEIDARWISLKDNPYVNFPKPHTDGLAPMKRDVSHLNPVIAGVDQSFDEEHRNDPKKPSNRLSQDRLNRHMVAKAKEHRKDREERMKLWKKKQASKWQRIVQSVSDPEHRRVLIVAKEVDLELAQAKAISLSRRVPGLEVTIATQPQLEKNAKGYLKRIDREKSRGRETVVIGVSHRAVGKDYRKTLKSMRKLAKAGRIQKFYNWEENGFKEKKDQELDFLFVGEGASYDVMKRLKEDWESNCPGLHIGVFHGNTYMRKKRKFYSGKGVPFKVGKGTIVMGMSQSGMSFSTADAIRDAEEMRQEGVLKDVFVITGEWFSVLGSTIGQKYFNDADFSGRIFSIQSGRRPSEVATMASAMEFLTIKMSIDLFKELRAQVPNGTPNGSEEYGPFNMQLTTAGLDRLERRIPWLVYDGGISNITGTNARGEFVDSEIHQAHLERGRQISYLISEQLFQLVTMRAYTFFSHLTTLPVFKGIALMITLLTVWASQGGSFLAALQAAPMLGVLMLVCVGLIAHILDTILATFLDVAISYSLRKLQGREMKDRLSSRFMAIGGLQFELSRDVYRNTLLEAPGALQLAGVEGRQIDGDFIFRFKDFPPRSTIVLIQFDNNKYAPFEVKLEAAAADMTVSQISGVKNFGVGPKIFITSLNPELRDAYDYPNLVIETQEDHDRNNWGYENDVETQFQSRWFNELKILISNQVVAAEKGEMLSQAKIPFYVRRSNSRFQVLLERMAHVLSEIFSMVVIRMVSLYLEIFERSPRLFGVFMPGRGFNARISTTQLVPPDSGTAAKKKRDLRKIAAEIVQNGIGRIIWVPQTVSRYVLASIFDAPSESQPEKAKKRRRQIPAPTGNGHGGSNGHSNGNGNGHGHTVIEELFEHAAVGSDGVDVTTPLSHANGNTVNGKSPTHHAGGVFGRGSKKSPTTETRSELRSTTTKLQVESLETRRMLNGTQLTVDDGPEDVAAFVAAPTPGSNPNAFDAFFAQFDDAALQIGSEAVKVNESAQVTQMDIEYSLNGETYQIALDDFEFDANGKPTTFTFIESRGGIVLRELKGRFMEFDSQNRPQAALTQDEKTGDQFEFELEYPDAVKKSAVGIVKELTFVRANGEEVIITIDSIAYKADEEGDWEGPENEAITIEAAPAEGEGGGGSGPTFFPPPALVSEQNELKPLVEVEEMPEPPEPGVGVDPKKVIEYMQEPVAEMAAQEPVEKLPAEMVAEAEAPEELPIAEKVEKPVAAKSKLPPPAPMLGTQFPKLVTEIKKKDQPSGWNYRQIAAASALGGMVYGLRRQKKQTEETKPVENTRPKLIISRNGRRLTLEFSKHSGVWIRNPKGKRSRKIVFDKTKENHFRTAGINGEAMTAVVDPNEMEVFFENQAGVRGYQFLVPSGTGNPEVHDNYALSMDQNFMAQLVEKPSKLPALPSLPKVPSMPSMPSMPSVSINGDLIKFILKLSGLVTVALLLFFFWEFIPAISSIFPSVAGLSAQAYFLPSLYFGGIIAAGIFAMWILRDENSSLASTSLGEKLQSLFYRVFFLAFLAGLAYVPLFFNLGSLAFLTAMLWFFYGAAAIAYFAPKLVMGSLSLISLPFRWHPWIKSKTSLRKDIHAVLGLAAIAAGYHYAKDLPVFQPQSESHIERIEKIFTPVPWKENEKPNEGAAATPQSAPEQTKSVEPEKADAEPEKTNMKSESKIEKTESKPLGPKNPREYDQISYEFQNVAPILYQENTGADITFPVTAKKEGIAEMNPQSQIHRDDWLNPGKAFRVQGSQELLRLKRPALDAKAEGVRKLTEYFREIEDMYQKRGVYTQRIVPYKQTQLYNKSAIIAAEIENYELEQQVEVFGHIRAPFREGEYGWILPGQRPLFTVNSSTQLFQAHSEKTQLVQISIPAFVEQDGKWVNVWQAYDPMKIKDVWVTMNGVEQYARVIGLGFAPRISAENDQGMPEQYVLTLALISDGQIFDYDIENNRAKPVENLRLVMEKRKEAKPYQLPPGAFSYDVVETGTRVSLPVNSAGIGYADFYVEESTRTWSGQVVGGVSKRDLERLERRAPEAAEFKKIGLDYLAMLQRLLDKKVIGFPDPDAAKIMKHFIEMKALLAQLEFMDYKAQNGILIGTLNSQGQAAQDAVVAEILTPQIFVDQQIEKKHDVKNGEIVIVRRSATGEQTIGIIRNVDRELANQNTSGNKGKYQEVRIELNNLPGLWFADHEYGIEVIYMPSSVNSEFQDKLQKYYQSREKKVGTYYRSQPNSNLMMPSSIQTVEPDGVPHLFPFEFMIPASDDHRELFVKLLEADQPQVAASAPKSASKFENLSEVVAREQAGESDAGLATTQNEEILRILNRSEGQVTRDRLDDFLNNPKISANEKGKQIEQVVLYGPADVAQMGLDHLRNEGLIEDLIALHRKLYEKSPDLDMTKRARKHIIELLENQEQALERLIQLDPADQEQESDAVNAQEFLASVLVADNAAYDLELGNSARHILESEFWRANHGKFALVHALENVPKDDPLHERAKKAALLVRSAIFVAIAEPMSLRQGEFQEHSKSASDIERFDGWLFGLIGKDGLWERLQSIDANHVEDGETLNSIFAIGYHDPLQYFEGKINRKIYDAARAEYESIEAGARPPKPQTISLLDFSPLSGGLLSDHVFNDLDPQMQLDTYFKEDAEHPLTPHEMQHFLEMSERPENAGYRTWREQVIQRLLDDETPESRLVLIRTFARTEDPDLLAHLLDKKVDKMVIEEANKQIGSGHHDSEVLVEQALIKIAGLNQVPEGQRRLALRTLFDGIDSQFELQSIIDGKHSLVSMLVEQKTIPETIVDSIAGERLARLEILWSQELAAQWVGDVTLDNQVVVKGESVFGDLSTSLETKRFRPENVAVSLQRGFANHPYLFDRFVELQEFRHRQVLRGADRDVVGHAETWRLSLTLLVGILGLSAGIGAAFAESKKPKPEAIGSASRSELREAAPGLLQALDAKEEFKHGVLVSILSRSVKTIESGEIVFNYNANFHTDNLANELAETMRENPGIQRLSLVRDHETSDADWVELKAALRSQRDFYQLRIVIAGENGFVSAEEITLDRLRARKLSRESIVQILQPLVVREEDHAQYDSLLLGAVPLGRETILLLGGEKPIPGSGQIFTAAEYLEVTLLAQQRFSQSA